MFDTSHDLLFSFSVNTDFERRTARGLWQILFTSCSRIPTRRLQRPKWNVTKTNLHSVCSFFIHVIYCLSASFPCFALTFSFSDFGIYFSVSDNN